MRATSLPKQRRILVVCLFRIPLPLSRLLFRRRSSGLTYASIDSLHYYPLSEASLRVHFLAMVAAVRNRPHFGINRSHYLQLQ